MCSKRNRYFNIIVSEIIFQKVVYFPCDSNIPHISESENSRGRPVHSYQCTGNRYFKYHLLKIPNTKNYPFSKKYEDKFLARKGREIFDTSIYVGINPTCQPKKTQNTDFYNFTSFSFPYAFLDFWDRKSNSI